MLVKACTMLYVKLVEEFAVKVPSWRTLSVDEVPATVPLLIDNLYRDLETEARIPRRKGCRERFCLDPRWCLSVLPSPPFVLFV